MDCLHARTEIRYVVISDGRRQYCLQCLDCGRRAAQGWLPKPDDTTAIRPFDAALQRQTEKAESAAWENNRQAERRRKHDEYKAFLASPAWAERRRRILWRDGDLCQCCLTETATQVHHNAYTPDTYREGGWEPLWNLRAVCAGCHKRLHGLEAAQ